MARSAFRAEVEVFGATQSADRMSALGYRAFNTFPLMKEIGALLYEQQKKRVESRPWTPLNPKTIANKTYAGENPDIFHSEWRMRRGKATRMANAMWDALTIDGAKGQKKRVTRTTASFGVNTKGDLYYVRFQQGTTHQPRRQVLAINANDAMEITMAITTYIDRGWEIGVSGGKEWLPGGPGSSQTRGIADLGPYALPRL